MLNPPLSDTLPHVTPPQHKWNRKVQDTLFRTKCTTHGSNHSLVWYDDRHPLVLRPLLVGVQPTLPITTHGSWQYPSHFQWSSHMRMMHYKIIHLTALIQSLISTMVHVLLLCAEEYCVLKACKSLHTQQHHNTQIS
jgi:hypothetical protein